MVRYRGGQFALMGRQNNRPAAVPEARQQRDHLPRRFDVHVGEGFVEQKKFG
jgi:hypothetical protein